MNFEKKPVVIELENVRIQVTMQGGFFDFGFGDKFRVHSHGDFEFHMAMQGESEFLTESGAYTLKDSEILIVEPYAIHSCVAGVDRTVKMSFCFSFAKVNKKGSGDLYGRLERAFSSVKNIKKIDGKKYIELVKKILFEFHSSSTFSQARLKSYFLLLITGIAQDIEPDVEDFVTDEDKGENLPERNLYRIMIEEYVNYNYNKEISLEHLAKALHLCEKQTSRIIQKEFGMSFREFVSKIRCGAAVYLLANTNMSITDIACKVGYRTYNGFYNMFVSCMKTSPEQYRSRIKKL